MKKSATPSVEKWIKVIVHLELDLEKYKELVRQHVVEFEDKFEIDHLYYARYTDLQSSTVEISAFTSADWKAIREFFKKREGITHTEIVLRDSGSLAHAYAYQAVKYIKPFEADIPEDHDLADVLHWMCNMRGMDYIREARLYSYRAVVELHKLAIESEKNHQALRNINARARGLQIASDLVDRLNLAGKRPKVDRTLDSAPRPTHKPPGRAASHKSGVAPRKKLSGSTRR